MQSLTKCATLLCEELGVCFVPCSLQNVFLTGASRACMHLGVVIALEEREHLAVFVAHEGDYHAHRDVSDRSHLSRCSKDEPALSISFKDRETVSSN